MSDFLHRLVPSFGGKKMFRLGFASNYGIDDAGIRAALEGPINYIPWTAMMRKLTGPLRDAIKRDRARYVISTGPTLGYLPGSARRRVERSLKVLRTDYIDVLQIYWLGKMSAWTGFLVDEMVKLREEGKVRALGVSIHDRERAGRLAVDSPLDMLMIRYNAAHPGAEKDIFPHLAKRKPAVIAYTATDWRRLLKAPKGWSGKVATPGDCYRFCLSSDHVDVVLCAPANLAQLEDNIRAVEKRSPQPRGNDLDA